MQHQLLNKYAHLLVNYCVQLEAGERLLIETTTLAEPLVREIYKETLKVGAIPHVLFEFRDQKNIQWQESSNEQLQYVHPLYAQAMQEFEAYIYLRAPFYSHEIYAPTDAQKRIHAKAHHRYKQAYAERTANGNMRRNLCEFPTIANAQNAGMSLEQYADFITNACWLNEENPAEAWGKVSKYQQKMVDFLNKKQTIRYKGEGTDLTFSTKGRIWMNSDGRTNMPSGEVYTSPVEDSAEGVVHFAYPSIYDGQEVEGITLWVKAGEIYKWEAKKGKALLDKIFQIEGARRFGEAAIGTNQNIQTPVKNILFDEKIGGTVHLAVGQAYLQTGGKNNSSVHWDMIADMKNGGEIFADGEKIYDSGKFLL